jgi:4-nitrophenyl phosphatase
LLDLHEKQLFLFDLDGVLIKGKEWPIKIGGTKILQRLKEKKKKVLLLTNNSTDTLEAIHSRLNSLHLPIEKNEILTSTRVTAEYISKNYGKAKYHLIGENGFDKELRRLGLIRTFGVKADVLVVGLDRRLTYQKLDRAVKTARNGADIIATHSARLYMYKRGPAIAVGPILKAIEYGSGKKGITIGKPSPLMFRIAMEKAGCKREEVIMIGDQEDTDIEGASGAGIDSILVLSGMEKEDKRTRAIATIRNVDELVDFI